MYRLILYDTVIYENPEKTVNAAGVVSDVRQKEKTTEITLKKVNVVKGTAVKKDEKLLIYLKTSDYLKIGQKVNVYGTASPFERAGNPGTFDASEYYHNKKYAYIVFADRIDICSLSYNHFKEGLRKLSDYLCGIYDRILPEGESQIMSAIVLGRRDGLNEEDIYLYRQGGCMHLFAVSGLHVSMISVIFLWIIARLPVSFNMGRFAVSILLIIYGIFTGFSISCMRAVIMILMSIAARLAGRQYDVPSGIAMAGIIILLISPVNLFSAAFLLSFGAVFAITVVSPYAMKYTGGNRFRALYPCVSASVVTLPMVLYYYNDAPLYSVALNLIIIPVMSLLFVLGIICLAVSCICMPFGAALAQAVHYILAFYGKLCEICSDNIYFMRIKGHAGTGNIVFYYIILFLTLMVIRINKRKIYNNIVCAAALVPLIFILSCGHSSSYLDITMLDVGQGDGIYINTPDNKTVMIDTGSTDKSSLSRYTIEPFLDYMGKDHIDIWFITHMDKDHYSGLTELLERSDINKITVGMLVLPDITDKEEFAELFNYSDYFERICFIGNGSVINAGKVTFSCINPEAGTQKYEDANDYSLVLNLSYKDFNMLFTGDISSETERKIMGDIPECDVVKIAHHGSGYSSCDEFLDRTKAKLALISAGKGNSYGHPDKETLDRLNMRGTDICVTMECGAVMLSTDGDIIRSSTYKDNVSKIYGTAAAQ